jgi:Arc/MetJ-type ribon-helix-helix transcriptional regulator
MRTISTICESDQEKVRRDAASDDKRLRRLRSAIDKGIRSLDAGEFAEFDIDEFNQWIERRGQMTRAPEK